MRGKGGLSPAGSGGAEPYIIRMYRQRQTPEEAAAKRAYLARGQRIRSGETPGLLTTDGKAIRPEIRELIDAALAKSGAVRPGADKETR
jgi:hypothetical protein